MFALLLLLIALVQNGYPAGEFLPPEAKKHFDSLGDICVAKIGISKDAVRSFDFSSKSDEIMCYMKCLMVEGKWVEDDGETIRYEFITEDLHPELKGHALPMLEKCRDIPQGNQECEKIYNFFSCLHDVDPEHFYLP